MRSPDNELSAHTIIRPKRLRLIKLSPQSLTPDERRQYRKIEEEDVEALPTVVLPALPTSPQTHRWEGVPQNDPDAGIPTDVFDISSMSTMRLMEISGMLRAVPPPVQGGHPQGESTAAVGKALNPYGGQQADALPVNDDEGEMFGQMQLLPPLPVTQSGAQETAKLQPAWKAILNHSVVRMAFGLLIGIGMLLLISRFVDIPTTVSILRQHLTTTQGVIFALLAAASFLAAFSIRGMRWRLFLGRICKISTLKSIQIFWVAVFLNFLLPVQGGEVAKSLILKQTERIPISKSLPTVAKDKSLDLIPALFIMAAVPFIPGIHMSATLWFILSLVSSILLGIILTVALMAWNRIAVTKCIQMVLKVLPKGIEGRIESFALGFIDSLLAGASRPQTFIPAVLLTCLALTCDGLFAWFAFLTVGESSMGFGTATFGYITYNMFSILPNPPGQVGSNEFVGVLVFSGLLGFPKTSVLAMFLFSHPLAALIMTTMSMVCLSGLGLSLTSVTKTNAQEEDQGLTPPPVLAHLDEEDWHPGM
jgi:uncharacterized protein (TIRG00374 family)